MLIAVDIEESTSLRKYITISRNIYKLYTKGLTSRKIDQRSSRHYMSFALNVDMTDITGSKEVLE